MTAQPKQIVGKISGKIINLPDVNQAPMPSIADCGLIKDGKQFTDFYIPSSPGQPDVLSFKRKFGLLIPATNTTMEHELWSIIFNNQTVGELNGIGIHTSNIQTPKIKIENADDLIAFKDQFIQALETSINQAGLSKPEYLIMGMSLEHILSGIEEIRTLMSNIEARHNYSWATWHDAADAALKKYQAKRIGIISPFIKQGNDNAIKMFEDIGYEVVTSFAFACGNLVDIAHIPNAAKEEVILKHIATPKNKLDAVVQLGTNMGMIDVAEKLENKIGIPILGINSTLFWYALRENGFTKPLVKAGRLLREF